MDDANAATRIFAFIQALGLTLDDLLALLEEYDLCLMDAKANIEQDKVAAWVTECQHQGLRLFVEDTDGWLHEFQIVDEVIG